MNEAIYHEGGEVVTEAQMNDLKESMDGVAVTVTLLEDVKPNGLQLHFKWKKQAKIAKGVDFILISYNKGHSFLGAFKYGTFGLELVYSENSHSELIRDLKKTKTVKIIESWPSNDDVRHTVELKHCS